MSRQRAVALIVEARRSLIEHVDERLPADARRIHESIAELDRLLLDVRAGRVDEFELREPVSFHVTISTG